VSNELSKYCGAIGKRAWTILKSFDAPGIGIDDHLACFKSPL
jgi:hypothetical protein